MRRTSKAIIKELQGNRQFRGTCPRCAEHFVLADATMFSVDDTPPDEALRAIKAARLALKERKLELVESYERMTEGAQKTAAAVNLGKIIEKIVPSFDSFMHHPGDCRALFEPIDYLIFSGLAKQGAVEALIFVDVKSGRSRLKPNQRQIKAAVESGKIEFAEIAGSR